MLFGSIYGFILQWGPIWWGLIGLASGFILGLIIKLVITSKYAGNRSKSKKNSEAVLIIECKEHEIEMARCVLWDNHALGVSKLDLN
jgi:hypothetical protein